MKRFVTNVFTAVACLFLLSPAAIAAPLRIVAIGDSITQGRGDHAGSGAKWTPTYGWRYAFWKNCVDAAIECRMVGSMTTGFESTPEYPEYRGKKFLNCHEARWGWTAEGQRDKLRETSKQWTADVALIYLGTNREPFSETEKNHDPEGILRTARAMRDLVAILRMNNPRMAIVIRGFAGGDARSEGLTRQYQKLAAELSTANSPVVISMPSRLALGPEGSRHGYGRWLSSQPTRGRQDRRRLLCDFEAIACTPPRTARASTSREPGDYVWLEGESPTTIPGGMAVGGAAQPSFLSGGKWLIFTADANEVEKKVPARRLRNELSLPLDQGRSPASVGPRRLRVRPRLSSGGSMAGHGPRSRPTN